jgi:hypothetical protein
MAVICLEVTTFVETVQYHQDAGKLQRSSLSFATFSKVCHIYIGIDDVPTCDNLE